MSTTPPPWPIPARGQPTTWRSLLAGGRTITVLERWHGLAWMAAPHLVMSRRSDLLVTAVPAGTVTVHATNRGLAYTKGMSRGQRKLACMATRQFRVSQFTNRWSSIHLFVPGWWAHVSFSWDEHGHAVGYYVNFESPTVECAGRLESKDLVLDAVIRGNRWEWKDLDEFDEAERLELFPAGTRERLMETAEVCQAALTRRDGPFDPALLVRPPDQPPARLSQEFAPGGSAWAPTHDR